MPIAVHCPECDARLNAPDAAAGKTLKCPKCKSPMVIPEAESAADDDFETVDDSPKKAASVKKPAPKRDVEVDDDEDEDDRPKAKKRPRDDDDDDDDRPKKKKKGKKKAAAGMAPGVLVGIIAGAVLLLGGGGFAVYWFGIREKPKETVNNSNTNNVTTGPQPGGPGPGGVIPPPSGGPGSSGGPPSGGSGKPLFPVSDNRSRQISNNSLKQIGLAFHNAESVYGGLPQGYFDNTGKVGLSWRVLILPFIEQDALFKQFKLTEPWDSEHNIKLLPKMPKLYAPPGGAGKEGFTYYRSFTGAGTAFPPPQKAAAGQVAKGLSLGRIPDGTSNTALVVEAGDPVEWTKPDELVYTPNGPLPKVGGLFGEGVHVCLGDGSTRFVTKMTPEKLKALITAGGGEIIDWSE